MYVSVRPVWKVDISMGWVLLQQQQSLHLAYLPSAANPESLVAPTAAGDLGLWGVRPGTFGPLPWVIIFVPEKVCSRYPMLGEQFYTTIQSLLTSSLRMQGDICPGLKRFLPSSFSLSCSFCCTNPWPDVKHLIFRRPLLGLGLHLGG